MFNYDFVTLPALIRHDGERRFYETPTGEKYPSVTTVLSAVSDKTFLEQWRYRIGIEEANKQTKRATDKGSATHNLCEKFILGEKYDLSVQPYNVTHSFRQLQIILNQSVDNIRAVEGSLFSHKLKIAGSVDLIADYNNIPSVIDFKTSKRNKRKEWIENYFLQTALYSLMFFELTGLMYKQSVIMIAVEEENTPQIFVEQLKDWYPRAINLVHTFYQNNS